MGTLKSGMYAESEYLRRCFQSPRVTYVCQEEPSLTSQDTVSSPPMPALPKQKTKITYTAIFESGSRHV